VEYRLKDDVTSCFKPNQALKYYGHKDDVVILVMDMVNMAIVEKDGNKFSVNKTNLIINEPTNKDNNNSAIQRDTIPKSIDRVEEKPNPELRPKKRNKHRPGSGNDLLPSLFGSD